MKLGFWVLAMLVAVRPAVGQPLLSGAAPAARAYDGRSGALDVHPPRIDQSPASQGAAANDVNMLVCTGGRQRSEPEFRALYDAAGFTLTRLVPLPPTQARAIEGVPA